MSKVLCFLMAVSAALSNSCTGAYRLTTTTSGRPGGVSPAFVNQRGAAQQEGNRQQQRFCRSLSRESPSSSSSSSSSLRAVADIGSEGAFDKKIKSSGDKLVIVDYSTTWCGPCKVIAPKFEELSEKYTDAIFLKVIGDASPDASKLMKREGVRSVPSFHYFVKGEKVDVINGANAEAIEAAITKHIHEKANK